MIIDVGFFLEDPNPVTTTALILDVIDLFIDPVSPGTWGNYLNILYYGIKQARNIDAVSKAWGRIDFDSEKIEEPEAEKVVLEGDIKCETLDCGKQKQDTQGQQQGQPKGTPSISSASSQANTVKTATQQNYANTGGINSYSNQNRITETSSGGRKIGTSGGSVRYNIPSSATYSSGFSKYLGSGKMKKSKRKS